MAYTESEMTSIRGELEIVQKALKLQTKRCRQLVAEYTRRLQEKEQQYRSEKALRDDQLAKVLRALLIFEARLKQEQKFISHQLNEKDYIIKKQSNDIKKLLSNQYCKNCNQYYTSSPIQESLDSSSEYVVTDYQDYQSSNFESLDSSSETYATISEKGYGKSESPYPSYITEENSKSETESAKNIFQKNRNKDSLGRRSKKIPHRKSIGTYFEVLKLRNDNASPISNEDNTSNDYDNLDSLPPESVSDKISVVSENIELIFNKNQDIINGTESSPNISLSECNNTVINKKLDIMEENNKNDDHIVNEGNNNENNPKNDILNENTEESNEQTDKICKITETIPVFDTDGETNDNWYASASDQEDEEHRDIYRNNPVLECMNQILLQNINDTLISPPKTPNVERKATKNKRVKFSDEEETKLQEMKETTLTQQNLNEKEDQPTMIMNRFLSSVARRFQIRNQPQRKKALKKANGPTQPQQQVTHFYMDMEPKVENADQEKLVRKSKILRTPPALPPKPANLVSKYKMQNISRKSPTEKSSEGSIEFEPDYCSISELNLPQNKTVSFKKINVVAEINAPTSQDVLNKLNSPNDFSKTDKSNKFNNKINRGISTEFANVTGNDDLVVKKCVEKLNIQLAKQTQIKSEATINPQSPKKNNEPEIPKLPQVSEIIIPDENEEKEDERISQDNYVKNNSQIFKLKTNRNEQPRRPIVIGSSVSSLITGFNNHQLLSEIKKKPERNKEKRLFSGFENIQNIDKQTPVKEKSADTQNFENFDLSQNFEEFKLDDCEIEEYNVEDDMSEDNTESKVNQTKTESVKLLPKEKPSTRVELIRATNDMLLPTLNKNSIELLKKQLELQKTQVQSEQVAKENNTLRGGNEPTYEHFLECTGLSSKSILTPSRLLSNHKSMLKPKDVKLRSKVKANNNIFERHSSGSIKYWSEPYI
ncbi:hypothetical protein NQ318_016107 [Aromia moschata]|uniref:Uncharacterized protein n=1 Tax=Aromia moschata TaxID=1265417 RepID=A0AAV8XZN2_9CUCU|nr:hypothetical protein NQ318_016107 [Aromia moschata]